MGLVNSHLKKKKNNLIKNVDILNNTVNNLQILITENNRQLNKMYINKNVIENETQRLINNYHNLEIKIKNLNNCATNFECKICMEDQ